MHLDLNLMFIPEQRKDQAAMSLRLIGASGKKEATLSECMQKRLAVRAAVRDGGVCDGTAIPATFSMDLSRLLEWTRCSHAVKHF